MKTFLATTAAIALVGTAAAAQDSVFRAESDPMAIEASSLIGMRVYSTESQDAVDTIDGVQTDWNDIGEINDIVLSRDGMVEAVLVDIGGFLGVGERQVAVNMDAIHFVADSSTEDDERDYFLVLNTTQDTLSGAPEYSFGQKVSDAARDVAAATTDAAGKAVEATKDAADTAAAATREVAQDATAAVKDAASDTAQAAREAGAAVKREITQREGYAVVASGDLTTEQLTGARAYDANDEWIGEVSKLIVDGNGGLKDAVIDVGGFLGLGEKPVRLSFSDLDILRKSDDEDDLRVYVAKTKEELEALPAYEE